MAQPQPSQAQQPLQHVPPVSSPVPSLPGFSLPPNKRVRTDGPGSTPGSPFPASPYASSPGPVGGTPTPPPPPPPTMTMTMAAPPMATPAIPMTTPTLPMAAPIQSPMASPMAPMAFANGIVAPIPLPLVNQYTSATMQPMPQSPAAAAAAAGMMGPPSKPAERPTKDYEYDVTDSLAGTGIDLRAEEQYMAELYSNTLESMPEARTGFGQLPPGGKSSFYGAGPANQPAEGQPADQTQAQYAAQAAEQAWTESSMRLAVQRTREINDPFLLIALLHRRADKIAREHHLGLNLELKNGQSSMGKMRLPEQFAQPKVTVRMQAAGEGGESMVETSGSFVPQDAFLVDQLALMSIATKYRLREVIEDANTVARMRQRTSHGDVPEEWMVAAAPMNAEVLERMDGQKRAADMTDANERPAKMPKIASHMTLTMREVARQEREWEETRLRRRQRRKEGTEAGGSRPGSVAPGTPGSVAPETERTMTKKEMKKSQAMKAAEASSHANQNMTSSMFAGLGGKGGLFGKKKSGKTYDWMNVGRGSGTSSPGKIPGGGVSGGIGDGGGGGVGGGGIGGMGGKGSMTGMAMTPEGRNRLGTWREDKEKGRGIQLRDWVAVLERDGRDGRGLQRAYLGMDGAGPR